MTTNDIRAVPTLDTDTLDKLRALAEQLRALDLDGRWFWRGNSKVGGYMLATIGHGQQFVMGFQRKGMNGAQPLFRVRPDGDRWAHMVKADEIPVHEVCPSATDRDDPRLYRHDVVGFRSPVADWMATVTPDVVLALLDLAQAADAKAGEAA